MELERRFLTSELRAVETDKGKRIIGYAAVFNSLSEDLGGFQEVIEPGAFAEAVVKDDVRALYNHDPAMVLGRNKAGTLALAEDEVGLRYEVQPPETGYARDLLVSMERGDVDQSSFGFMALEDEWRQPGPGQPLPVRVLKRVKLFDVSPVTFPAYPATSVAVRDMALRLSGQAAGEIAAIPTAGRLAVKRHKLDLVSS